MKQFQAENMTVNPKKDKAHKQEGEFTVNVLNIHYQRRSYSNTWTRTWRAQTYAYNKMTAMCLVISHKLLNVEC